MVQSISSSAPRVSTQSPPEISGNPTLCQRVTRIFFQFIGALARIFCCCRENSKTPTSTDQKPPPNLSSRVSSTSRTEAKWHEPGVLIAPDNATENPIESLLGYEDEIAVFLSQRKELTLSVEGTDYIISRPQEGTLQIQQSQSSTQWTLQNRETDEDTTLACCIVAKNHSKKDPAQILSILKELDLQLAALFQEERKAEKIQNELTPELLSALWQFARSNKAMACRNAGVEVRIPNRQNPELMDSVRVRIQPLTVSGRWRTYQCQIRFQVVGTPEELSLVFNEQGHLNEISINPSLASGAVSPEKLFGNQNHWSHQIREIVGELLVAQTTNVNYGDIEFHTLALQLSPLSILRKLSIDNSGKLHINHAYVLNDEFIRSDAIDQGGPRRQFISDLSHYFLTGRSTLPFGMRYQLPFAQIGARDQDVQDACRYLAALIAYCHSTTVNLNADATIVMGRVLDDTFFEIIRYIHNLEFLEENFNDNQEQLFVFIKAVFRDLSAVLPTIDINEIPIEPGLIADALDFYDDPEVPVHFKAQFETLIHALAGDPTAETIPEGFNAKEALKDFLVEQFGSIMITIQSIARHLPQEVTNAILEAENGAAYSLRIQGLKFDRNALANRITASEYQPEEIRQKAEWIRKFIRDERQNQEWVEMFLSFVTGSSTLPQGKNITIVGGDLGKACKPHTCSFSLEVPTDHPRIGLAKGTLIDEQGIRVDDERAFFHHIDYCIKNGVGFAER